MKNNYLNKEINYNNNFVIQEMPILDNEHILYTEWYKMVTLI